MIDSMLKVFQVAFYFLLGCLCVFMVLCAVVMLLFIINATIEELFKVNICEWIAKRIRHERL